MGKTSLQYYFEKLTKLRVANTKHGKAPHKPVLLISLIELIERGTINRNVFEITPQLVAEFKENWSLLVNTKNTCDFSLPFYHLQSDGFWNVWLKNGKQLRSHIRSIFVLMEEVSHATLSDDLFALMLQPASRNQLLNVLLDKYFPTSKLRFLKAKQKGNEWLKSIENNILLEGKELPTLTDDEDVSYIRSAAFQQLVLRTYNNTCAISRMKVIPVANYSLVDACHIVAFRESGDNTITNGIALCPNLHRAFDRGLIAIDDDYKVLVSEAFDELEENPYSLRSLNGKQILLPDMKKYRPDLNKIRKHRMAMFSKIA